VSLVDLVFFLLAFLVLVEFQRDTQHIRMKEGRPALFHTMTGRKMLRLSCFSSFALSSARRLFALAMSR
jgi:hypothetical protein